MGIYRSQTLKPNTVIGNGNEQTLHALCDWIRMDVFMLMPAEERERVETAINALGKHIVSGIEAAYNQTRWKVTIQVYDAELARKSQCLILGERGVTHRTVYIEAETGDEAREEACRKVWDELDKSRAGDFKVEVVNAEEDDGVPMEKNYKVMVRVKKTTTSDIPIYVKAMDDKGALFAANKKVGGDLKKSGDTSATASAYDAKECDEEWLQKEGGAE